MSREVIILRGPSGSGKSHFCRDHNCVVSADSYFMYDGVYLFNSADLGRAHQTCFATYIEHIENNEPVIVVDNTNIQFWQFECYIMVAKMRNYTVKVVEFEIKTLQELRRVAYRSKAPFEVVCRMAHDFEPYDGAIQMEIP